MDKKSVFEGRSTRYFQSQSDVFRIVSDWAARNGYELYSSDSWFMLYRKQATTVHRLVSCTYYEGWYRIEAWLSPSILVKGPAMPQETILEMSAIGVGEAQKKIARKEVNTLLRTLNLEPIGKLKGFYWR
jgi:hypothetical protein